MKSMRLTRTALILGCASMWLGAADTQDPRFTRADANGDGKVTLAELQQAQPPGPTDPAAQPPPPSQRAPGPTELAAQARFQEVLAEVFAKLDANQDGGLDPVEFAAFPQTMRTRMKEARLAERFAAVDADHNGLISLSELQQAPPPPAPGGRPGHQPAAAPAADGPAPAKEGPEVAPPAAEDQEAPPPAEHPAPPSLADRAKVLAEVFAEADADRNQGLDRNEFARLEDLMRTRQRQAMTARLFAAADADHDGKLTLDEVRTARPAGPRQPPVDLEAAFKTCDANHDGALDLQEFAGLQPALQAQRFATLDRDGDGFLTPEELQAARPGQATDGQGRKPGEGRRAPARFFEEADRNGDGKLDLQEFQDLPSGPGPHRRFRPNGQG